MTNWSRARYFTYLFNVAFPFFLLSGQPFQSLDMSKFRKKPAVLLGEGRRDTGGHEGDRRYSGPLPCDGGMENWACCCGPRGPDGAAMSFNLPLSSAFSESPAGACLSWWYPWSFMGLERQMLAASVLLFLSSSWVGEL